jgi:mRNA interferase RelE/StbE
MTQIKILQMPGFTRAYKRLHKNQKTAVDEAVKAVVKNPHLGEAKKGDLAGVHVHKFNCINQRFLLAYEFDVATRTLLAIGLHENFYRDPKQ